MKCSLKYFLTIVSIVGMISLSACHNGDKSAGSVSTPTSSSNIFGSGCSGSYSEQLECYAKKFVADNIDMEKAKAQCKDAKDSDAQGMLAKCTAVAMAMRVPKTIEWLNKPEPYSGKTANFFKNTSDQIRADEYGWCVANRWSTKSIPISGSCSEIDNFMFHASPNDDRNIKRMIASVK